MRDRYKEDLDWFVGEMVKKLDENNHKGSWKDEPIDSLFLNLLNEVDELSIEVKQPDCYKNNQIYENIIKECADVANFAMMIAERAKAGIK